MLLSNNPATTGGWIWRFVTLRRRGHSHHEVFIEAEVFVLQIAHLLLDDQRSGDEGHGYGWVYFGL